MSLDQAKSHRTTQQFNKQADNKSWHLNLTVYLKNPLNL